MFAICVRHTWHDCSALVAFVPCTPEIGHELLFQNETNAWVSLHTPTARRSSKKMGSQDASTPYALPERPASSPPPPFLLSARKVKGSVLLCSYRIYLRRQSTLRSLSAGLPFTQAYLTILSLIKVLRLFSSLYCIPEPSSGDWQAPGIAIGAKHAS
eukprot:gb/GEZJ01002996.1/.p1 GENE.gb/GEZJ01002996.1/~~gb/GEZJ01002996.1/.p1  ORF type:complete len:157 (-),score=2.93 gb/GEZJ01002996.1/:39-509(-)